MNRWRMARPDTNANDFALAEMEGYLLIIDPASKDTAYIGTIADPGDLIFLDRAVFRTDGRRSNPRWVQRIPEHVVAHFKSIAESLIP